MDAPILILFGTVTGNAEACAICAAARLNKAGYCAEVRNISEVRCAQLNDVATLLICICTYGEGEPPTDAVPMWKSLMRDGGLDLSSLSFSVLALGDSAYEKFCQCGKDLDVALQRYGAFRLAARVEADVEYERECFAWIESVLAALKGKSGCVARQAAFHC